MIVQFSTGGRGRDPAGRGLSLAYRPDMASLSTGSVASALPVMILYYLAQRFVVQGLAAGSVKG